MVIIADTPRDVDLSVAGHFFVLCAHCPTRLQVIRKVITAVS